MFSLSSSICYFVLVCIIGACFGPGAARVKSPVPLCVRSGDLDLDLLRLGLLGLGQMHGKHAVFELGGDLPGAGVIRERETASEAAVGAFDAVIFLAFLLLLKLRRP